MSNKKTVQEQLNDLSATCEAKEARQSEIMEKALAEGRTTDAAEAEEYDNLDTEIAQIKGDMVRLDGLKKRQIAEAKAVEAPTAKAASESREIGAPAILKHREKDEAFEGQNYVRKTIARALSQLDHTPATNIAMARGWHKSNPRLVEVIKVGEVAGGGSDSGEWGAELVQSDARFTGDFIDFLYSQTVYDRLPLREIPANVTVKGQDGTATANWVGQSKGIPVSAQDYSTVSLTPLKVAAISVVSLELLRDSSPAAEMLVRDSLVQASAQKIDTTFLSADAAVSGVSPAGILNGVTADVASGTDDAALRADLKTLYSGFITAKNADGLYIVTTPSLAKSISLMVNSLGLPSHANITANGGTLLGDPVVTGHNVGAGDMILMKPSDIYKIGDRGVTVSVSRDATIEMNTTPLGDTDTPTAQSATPVGMFQTESVAFKVVRPINFAKRRSSAVDFVGDGAYA